MTVIQEFPGVKKADLNSKTWQATVVFETGKENLQGLIRHFDEKTDFTLKKIPALGMGKIVSLKDVDVAVICSDGEECELTSHIVEGKYTVVAFTADWCIPCKVLEKKLVTYMRSHDQIALRQINIVKWGSPVTKQHMEGEKGIPFVIIFGPDGSECYRGPGDYEKVVEVMK